MSPGGLEPRLTVEDIELHLEDDNTYVNRVLASSPICQRTTLAVTLGQASPTTFTAVTSPVTATATVISDVDRVSSTSVPALTQRNTSYMEAINSEKDEEEEVGYVSTPSEDVFVEDSDTETTDTDSDAEIVISYSHSPTRVPHSPLVRQKPLEKLHGTQIRHKYDNSMQEGAEGDVNAVEALLDERASSSLEAESQPSRIASNVVETGTTTAEMGEQVGSLGSPDTRVSLPDRVTDGVEASNDPATLSRLASVELKQKHVEGSTIEAESGRSSEESNEVVSLEGPSPLRRQGSVKKLIANFEVQVQASAETSTSRQRKASNAGIQKSAESLSDVSSSAQQKQLGSAPLQSENLKSDNKWSEPLAEIGQSEGPKIRQALQPVRQFVSVKVSAAQGRKQQKRKSSERSGVDVSECTTDIQVSQDEGSAGADAVLSSPKKVKLSLAEVGHSSPPNSLQLEESLNLVSSTCGRAGVLCVCSVTVHCTPHNFSACNATECRLVLRFFVLGGSTTLTDCILCYTFHCRVTVKELLNSVPGQPSPVS